MNNELINIVGYWTCIDEGVPDQDGTYLTEIITPRYRSVEFTDFRDGEFMSSFVRHWAKIRLPNSEFEMDKNNSITLQDY